MKKTAFTLADEESPAYLPGAFELALGSLRRGSAHHGIFPHWRSSWVGMNTLKASSTGVKSLFVQACR